MAAASKLAPPASFLDYPKPTEVKSPKYEPRKAANPVLRGFPLAVASTLISKFGFVANLFWNNAGFPTIKDLPELDDVPSTYHPCVIPLGESGPMVAFESAQLNPKKRPEAKHHYTASDYHEMYKSGKLTPLQVAETLLALTSKYADKPSKYQDAWADSHGADDLVLEAAKESTARYAAGKPLGILDGVPIGVKDDIEVKGYSCHNGMKYQKGVPFFDAQEKTAWPVQKLQEAGAVVIGKNRMQELGSDTNGLNFNQGSPTNHLNNEYYPGGSTSGGGSAVGVGVVPLVLGTDAGGSVRIPSTFNGIYGLKPSHHRTMYMNNTMCIVGPVAANVSDLTIAYRLISQPDATCSTQSKFAVSIPPSPSAKRYIGIDRDWWSASDPRVAEICNKAIDHFKSKGYEVVDITIPFIDEAQTAHSAITITEMATIARRRGTASVGWFSLFGPVNRVLMSLAQQATAMDYIKFNAMRTLVMRHVAWLFQKYPGLLIMTPTSPMTGWAKSAGDDKCGVSDGDTTIRNMLYVFLANLTGTPSLSAPVGYAEPDQGEGKLCVSLMATSEWGSEELLLSWAAEAEEYLHDVYEDGRRKAKDWVDVLKLAAEHESS